MFPLVCIVDVMHVIDVTRRKASREENLSYFVKYMFTFGRNFNIHCNT